MTRRLAAFLVSFVIIAGTVAYAQTGGFPSRPKFQQVTASAVTAFTPNVFALNLTSTSPGMAWYDTDQALDAKLWIMRSNGGTVSMEFGADNGTGRLSLWTAARDGQFAVFSNSTGAFEVSRLSGAIIDMKDAPGDDYDVRIAQTGANMALTATTVSTSGDLTVTGNATVAGISLAPLAGTFVANISTGCTSATDLNYKYAKIGSSVTISVTDGNNSCVSNAVRTIAAGAVPAGIRPAVKICMGLIGVLDNNIKDSASLSIDTNGDMEWNLGTTGTFCGTGNSWTASGTKLVGQHSAAYVM